ncbi:M48 family metalloprotease [Aquincola sp. S2]|uniref:M48 family metalloprotease n=1 Tax=Pseudaquabacterium terrae TaxID=2732868 RepID=A0ABX2E9P8_9BURK|nr:M48 family metalloprotease [Aquabacterium terrae]NRF65749.1 M48 family metalloprotease [Aquabacterium terrae]
MNLHRRQTLFLLPAAALAPQAFAFDLNKALGAAQGAAKAASLSDDDIRAHARSMAAQMDAQSRIAPATSAHAKRLAALTQSCREDKGLALNYKVYQTPEVNAFALADGSIRFYSGLMDMMSDDEVRYVIGHEIGHVQAGHSKKRMQVALGSGAAREAALAAGGKAGALASSELGDLFVKVVRAQHSQSNENEADDYAMQFLSRRQHDRRAAVSALEKLDKMSGGGGAHWLSTHPAPRDRAQRMRTQLGGTT